MNDLRAKLSLSFLDNKLFAQGNLFSLIKVCKEAYTGTIITCFEVSLTNKMASA